MTNCLQHPNTRLAPIDGERYICPRCYSEMRHKPTAPSITKYAEGECICNQDFKDGKGDCSLNCKCTATHTTTHIAFIDAEPALACSAEAKRDVINSAVSEQGHRPGSEHHAGPSSQSVLAVGRLAGGPGPDTKIVSFSEISRCGILSADHYVSGEHDRVCKKS